jgi:hypothetical protein
MTLNKASWDAAMTSIGARLREREALEASFEALIDIGVGQAIAAVQSEIGPTAAQAQADANAIAAMLDTLINDGVPTASVLTSAAARFTSNAEMNGKASASALADLVAAVALKAPLASPAFTGAPTAPTPGGADNSTKLATTAFVKTAIAALVASAPGALDTLDELAAALGDDANFASTVTSALAARLRFDAAQSLSAGQKTQAQTNLGLGSLATQSAVNPADLPGGVWVRLATLTASNSASLEVTPLDNAYDEYEIVFENIRPVTDAVDFLAQVFSGGSYRTTSYSSLSLELNSVGQASVHLTTAIDLSGGSTRMDNAAGSGLSGFIRIMNPSETANYKRVFGQNSFNDNGASGSGLVIVSAAWRGGTGAITKMQFYMSSGNISSGKIYLYGRKK